MMFLLDLAFSTELIALGIGVTLLVWALRNDGSGIMLAKFFGYVITILAILSMACTSYFSLLYLYKGYFSSVISHMPTPH